MYNKFNKYMAIYLTPKNIKYIITVLFILGAAPFVFSQGTAPESSNRGYIESSSIPEIKKGTVIFGRGSREAAPSKELEKNLSELQKQARLYRREGLGLQKVGNLEGAMSFYQKAIEIDPSYAVAYNDLGIIYEAGGAIERAEDCYLKAIKIDSNYLNPYTNLALLYENKRDLDKAAFYWKKRADLGSADDLWTQKAKQRLKDILAVQEGHPSDLREQEVMGLTQDVLNQKSLTREDNRELAKVRFQNAKLSYEKQDEVTALKQAIDALLLDPSNKEIEEFIAKVQKRLLSR